MKYLYESALRAFLIGAALWVAGCTSGESEYGGIEGTGGQLSSPVSATGSVTAFGSIWVNGVRFDVANALITQGEETLTEADIQPGMVVHVEGEVDANGNAIAKTVEVEANFIGAITEIVHSGQPYSEVKVLGQTVIIPQEAVFSGASASTIKVGDNVIISGLQGNNGSTLATRVELAAASDKVKLEGVINSIDIVQYRLMIGAVEVDFSTATFHDGTAQQLAVGQRVQIEAVHTEDNAILEATTIRVKKAKPQKISGSRVYDEGVIESFASISSFSVNGRIVDASISSISRGSITSLANGVRITLEGKINDQGVLVAQNIKVLLPSETLYVGEVEAINLDEDRVTILGTAFTTDSHTAYEDLSTEEFRRIDLEQIQLGDRLEVFGRRVNGEWVATRIRRIDAEDTPISSLRGQVGVILTETEFYLMGILVDASDIADDDPLETLQSGQWITVRGTLTGPTSMKATWISDDDDHCPMIVENTCRDHDKEEDKSGPSDDSSDDSGRRPH